jgi:outer membrane lipoprotein-sorting protein
MRRLSSILLALLTPVGAFAQSNVELPPIVKKMMGASRVVRYVATVNIERIERDGEKKTTTQFVLRDGPRTRIFFPKDSPNEGQIIVETEKDSRHYFPKMNLVLLTPRLRQQAREHMFDNLGKDAKVEVVSSETLLDRKTSKVEVREKGVLRQALWIDNTTGVVLRREMFRNGKADFVLSITRINFNTKIRDDHFKLEPKGARVVSMAEFAKELARSEGFLSATLPASEKKYPIINVRVINDKQPILHITYRVEKGGILSLFQSKSKSDFTELKNTPNGVKAYVWAIKGKSFALLGNLPELELRRLAGLVQED